MTRIDLTALRTLAEDASPGPWVIEPHPYGNSPARSIHVADRDADEFPVVTQLGCGCCDVGLGADAEDLSYIAALNPATVLRLLDALEAVLELHRRVGIYDECECTDDEKEARGHEDIYEVGLTCNRVYDICGECCRDDVYQSEDCANHHQHALGGDYCPTVAAITTALKETDDD